MSRPIIYMIRLREELLDDPQAQITIPQSQQERAHADLN